MPSIASWSVNMARLLTNREYFLLDGRTIPPKHTGQDLESKKWAEEAMSHFENPLASLRIYTDLPKEFFEEFLRVQYSSDPIRFPKMQEDKNLSVLSCMKKHSSFGGGVLAIKNWKSLGWHSEKDYQQWLNSSMLTAFSGTLHYCSAVRRFNFVPREKENIDFFEENDCKKENKLINILSVAAFEYRNMRYGKDRPFNSVKETVREIQKHAQKIMAGILKVANDTGTTNVLIIPFGMGVFLPDDQESKNKVQNAMYTGMKQALAAYNGSKITIHSCGFRGFYENLFSNTSNPKITVEDKKGLDAYSLANSLEDSGKNSMIVNAGDNDWTAGLNSRRLPGQCFLGHTLYNSTADEYLGLMTSFSFFSIERAITAFGKKFSSVITSTYSSDQLDQSKKFDFSLESRKKEKTRGFRYVAPLILGGIMGVLVGAVAAALFSSLALVGVALVAVCSGLVASVLSVGIAYRLFGLNTNESRDSIWIKGRDSLKVNGEPVEPNSSAPPIVQKKREALEELSTTDEPSVTEEPSPIQNSCAKPSA